MSPTVVFSILSIIGRYNSWKYTSTVGNNVHILWIENQQQFVNIALEKFLAAHTVTVFPSLADAKVALASDTFDAVLLDYDLDDGKGTGLFPYLDALPVRPVIIASSSHADGNALLMLSGADAVCSKMDFSQIDAVITAEFNRKTTKRSNCIRHSDEAS